MKLVFYSTLLKYTAHQGMKERTQEKKEGEINLD